MQHVHISQKSPQRINYVSREDNDQDISFVIGPGAQRRTNREMDDNNGNAEMTEDHQKENDAIISEMNVPQESEKSNKFLTIVVYVLHFTAVLRFCFLNIVKFILKFDFLGANNFQEMDEVEKEIAHPFVTKYHSIEKEEPELQPIVLKGSDGNKILSGLLEKGQKLRDDMIKSSLNSQTLRLNSNSEK